MPAKKTPARRSPDTKIAGISSSAVKRATGKEWKDWLPLLDKAGARTMDHKQIAALLDKHHPEIGGWWIQMVTVGYEQARGLRVRHETQSGFEISVTRTFHASIARLYEAFFDPRVRKRWLEHPGFEIRMATINKSLRINWPDATSVTVSFQPKGSRGSVTVQHLKLASAKAAAQRKAYWAENLERLARVVRTTPLPATRPRRR